MQHGETIKRDDETMKRRTAKFSVRKPAAITRTRSFTRVAPLFQLFRRALPRYARRARHRTRMHRCRSRDARVIREIKLVVTSIVPANDRHVSRWVSTGPNNRTGVITRSAEFNRILAVSCRASFGDEFVRTSYRDGRRARFAALAKRTTARLRDNRPVTRAKCCDDSAVKKKRRYCAQFPIGLSSKLKVYRERRRVFASRHASVLLRTIGRLVASAFFTLCTVCISVRPPGITWTSAIAKPFPTCLRVSQPVSCVD